MMEHRLYIDIGNTRIKAAVSHNGHWKEVLTVSSRENNARTELESLVEQFDEVVVATVRHDSELLTTLEKAPQLVLLQSKAIPVEKITYRNPGKLGVDRFLACLGAWSVRRKSVIVTDAGTACTIDVMDASGVFVGGVIMPGRTLLSRMLGQGADGLYDVSSELFEHWPPRSTQEALQAGTTGTFIAAWKEHVRKTRQQYPDAELWITGGEAELLKKQEDLVLKTDPHLVMRGMAYWMTHWRA